VSKDADTTFHSSLITFINVGGASLLLIGSSKTVSKDADATFHSSLFTFINVGGASLLLIRVFKTVSKDADTTFYSSLFFLIGADVSEVLIIKFGGTDIYGTGCNSAAVVLRFDRVKTIFESEFREADNSKPRTLAIESVNGSPRPICEEGERTVSFLQNLSKRCAMSS
ncbi:MAG TPA: hypothetical protein PLW02_07115, partial [Verrucomicrobiota bacterium]|nr:hypothetical protein [Verrucomicrobiota bacterium]